MRVRSASDTFIAFARCMLHRDDLVAKKIFPDLNPVMQDAVKVINFMRSRTLNTRNFCKFM